MEVVEIEIDTNQKQSKLSPWQRATWQVDTNVRVSNIFNIFLMDEVMLPCVMGKPERRRRHKQPSHEFSVCNYNLFGKCVSTSQFVSLQFLH